MKSLLLFLLFPVLAVAYPAPEGAVTDLVHVLGHDDVAAIRQEVLDLENRTSIELAVVTVPSLEGKSVEDYTLGLGNAWGVGKAGKNNGVVFLIAPTERKTRILVGAGSRSRLSDAEAGRIIQDLVLPEFRAGRLPTGIRRGTSSIVLQLLREPVQQVAPSSAQPSPSVDTPPGATSTGQPVLSTPENPSGGFWPTLASVIIGLGGIYCAVVLLRRRSLLKQLSSAQAEEEAQNGLTRQAAELLDRVAVSSPEISTSSLRTLRDQRVRQQASNLQLLREMAAVATGSWSLLGLETLSGKLKDIRSEVVRSGGALQAALVAVQAEARAKVDFLESLGPDGTMARRLAEAHAFARAHPTLGAALTGKLPALSAEADKIETSSGSEAGGSWIPCAKQSDRVLTSLRKWMDRAADEIRMQREAQERLPGLLLTLPASLRQVSSEVSGSAKARALVATATSQLQQARQNYSAVNTGGMDLNDMVMVYLLMQSSQQNMTAAQETWKRERESDSSPGWFSSASTGDSGSSSGFGGGSFDSGSSSGGDSGGASGSW